MNLKKPLYLSFGVLVLFFLFTFSFGCMRTDVTTPNMSAISIPLKSPDLNDPIIGTWVRYFPNGGYWIDIFESNGQWSGQEIYNGGSILRSIPPGYGTWKRLENGVYSVNQSGFITIWYYNLSQDKIYEKNATQLYSRVNSSQIYRANKS